MPRRGENIYKRKDGRYEGRYVIGRTKDGKTRFGYVYGHSYAEVRRELLLKKAETYQSDPPPFAACTVRDWIREWMESELRGSVKPSSYQTYRNLINRHLLPLLGDRLLTEITPGTAYEFVDALQASGLSHSTVKGVYRLFSSVMRYAMEEGKIAKNPCRKIKVQPPETLEQRVLSRKEYEMLHYQALEDREIPILLGMYTGMRLGEVCALKWSDINWDKRTVTIRRTVQRIARPQNLSGKGKTQLVMGTPKSMRSRRVLPVPNLVMELLQSEYEKGNNPEFIFGKKGKAAEPRTIQRRFQNMLDRLGIHGVHFHTLRHSFATQLIELGVDIKTISTLMGHYSSRVTLDYYTHSQLDQQRSAVKILEDSMHDISRHEP